MVKRCCLGAFRSPLASWAECEEQEMKLPEGHYGRLGLVGASRAGEDQRSVRMVALERSIWRIEDAVKCAKVREASV